jgi:hypothetical protein
MNNTIGDSLISLSVKFSQVHARPKMLLKINKLIAHAAIQHQPPNNEIPGADRGKQQNKHNQLNGNARPED